MNQQLDTVSQVVNTFEHLYETLGSVASFNQGHLDLVTASVESCAASMNCGAIDLLPILTPGTVVSVEDLREDLWRGVKAGAKAIWDGFLTFIEWAIAKIKGTYRRLKNGLSLVKQSIKRRIAARKEPSKETVDNLNNGIKAMQKERSKEVETTDTEWVLRSEKNKHNFGMIKKPEDITKYIQLMTTTAEKILPSIPDSKDIEKFFQGLVAKAEVKGSQAELSATVKTLYQDMKLDKMTSISLPDPMAVEYDTADAKMVLRDRNLYFSQTGKASSGKLDFSDEAMLKIVEVAEAALQSQVFERAYDILASYKKILADNMKRLETLYDKNQYIARMNLRLLRDLMRSSVDVMMKPLHAVEDLVKAIHAAENMVRNTSPANTNAKDIDKE